MINTLLIDIASRFDLRKGSGRYVGACPKCGGSVGSNKFVLKVDGGFKCYSCDFKGDIITWLREMDGKTCPEAHELAGISCRSSSCQVKGTCRLGDGSGKRPARVRQSVVPPPKIEAKLPVGIAKTPQEAWQIWTSSLVEKAEKALQEAPETLQWLAGRGIDADSAVRFRLGWLGHNRKVNRKSIGLQPKDGKDTLWIPDGLVIPIFVQDGSIHRLRIRRPDSSRAKFLPDLKYVWIEGSGNVPMVIRPSDQSRGAVVVEAELDAMAVAAAHSQITVIALGTVSAGIPADLRVELAASPTILVALDADQGKDGKPGPGPGAVKMWLKEYRQARFHPVPSGKDPGDYAKAGGDLRLWIESGLIPAVQTPGSHDLSFSPGGFPAGGRGEKNIPLSKIEPLSEPVHYIITLTDGREIHVTDNRELWDELTAAGLIAFSEEELQRFKAACSRMDKEQREAAAIKILEMKEVFPGAYIKRGEAIA